jgi:hypothetical protein
MLVRQPDFTARARASVLCRTVQNACAVSFWGTKKLRTFVEPLVKLLKNENILETPAD